MSAKFCSECCYDFNGRKSNPDDSAINIGDKNVIAGDVIGKQENYHIAGSATIIKHEEEFKKLVQCHICGHQILKVKSVECPVCHLTVCQQCFVYENKSCVDCLQRENSSRETVFIQKLEETQGVISLETRKNLIDLQKTLGLNDQRARELEEQVVGKYQKSQPASSYIQQSLNQAMDFFYDHGNARKAYELLLPLYKKYSHDESVFEAFIQIAIRVNYDEAINIIKKVQADSPGIYLARIDHDMENNNLASADSLLHTALNIWPDNILFRCRKILCLMALAKEMRNDSLLGQVRELFDSLPAPRNKLEASWICKVRSVVAGSENGPEITGEYCQRNNLYYFIAAPTRITVINIRNRTTLNEDQLKLLKEAEKGDWDALAELLEADRQNADIYMKVLVNAADNGDPAAQMVLGQCYSGNGAFEQNYTLMTKYYFLAAEQNYAPAQNKLGFCYYCGVGVKKDNAEAFKYFSLAANQGLAEAQYYLGEFFLNGVGCKVDDFAAREWFFLSADQGYADGQFFFGLCNYEGIGEAQNYFEAVKYFRLAAEKGQTQALYYLGKCCEAGDGIGQDYSEAVKCYRLAYEQNHVEAAYALGRCYYHGYGVDKNYSEAIKLFRFAADSGLAAAQYYLGECCYYGYGVNKDYFEAVKYYRLAADQNLDLAQYALGECLYYGTGINQNYAEAMEFYRAAAAQNHIEAQHSLGYCYYHGKGVVRNYAEAVKYFRIAADHGWGYAQFFLGECYERGNGVNKNIVEAVKYYGFAAENGIGIAQFRMGNCYYYGDGVQQSYAEAVKYYQLAADNGNADAMLNLGFCYECGNGVKMSKANAFEYYRLAADNGNDIAQSNLAIFYREGIGVAKNAGETIKYLRLAIDNGNVRALHTLGSCYAEGFGVSKNLEEAVKYYKLAVEKGEPYALNSLAICYEYGDGVRKSIGKALKYYRLALEAFKEKNDADMTKDIVARIKRCKKKRKWGKRLLLLLLILGAWYYFKGEGGAEKVSSQIENLSQQGKSILKPNPVKNLRELGKALELYRNFNNGELPHGVLKTGLQVEKDEAAAWDVLIQEAYLADRDALIVSFDHVNTPAAIAKRVLSNNTSYVYIFSGLKKGNIPVAFEKPWLIPPESNEINVLFANGEVETITIPKVSERSCREVLIQVLKNKKVKCSSRSKELMFHYAELEDSIHQQKNIVQQ